MRPECAGAYAGIGSRRTPPSVLSLMEGIAYTLGREKWVLRSGGADGADTAFERGAKLARDDFGPAHEFEIYLPWNGFNGRPNAYESPAGWLYRLGFADDDEIAERFHPNWAAWSSGARKLHRRNVAQILGTRFRSYDECEGSVERRDPISKFVVCWTPGGAGGGGTGQALRIAKHYNVPVFDLGDETVRFKVELWQWAEEPCPFPLKGDAA